MANIVPALGENLRVVVKSAFLPTLGDGGSTGVMGDVMKKF